MPRPPADFFRYVLPHAEAAHWGVVVTGGGMIRARAGDPYPPAGHPADHSFEWRNGRVLAAFQVVHIAQGAGEFESEATGAQRVVAGTALLLFPGVWHRYRPDPATGWTEKWVEFDGTVPQRLAQARVLTPAAAVVAVASPEELEASLDRIHESLRRDTDDGEAERSAGALGVLALLQRARPDPAESKPVAVAVARARRLMEEEGAARPLPDLARELGVAYSSFRREFVRRTGLSPQQYQGRVRLQRAQRLLGGTDQTIKQIADRLGFSSAFHLSAAFAAHFGLPPREWRRRTRRGGTE
ncbi:MAG TPA: AraC family transcriptional regulator [Lacunisphaera sp.]|nr:AraC family transcriptional regulator [Lacunisphaera sp.]